MASDRGLRTIPNLVTIVRLALIPVFLWLLWVAQEWAAAAALLGVLGATDWVDGWIARRFDQGSDIGKILDPVADRVLLLAASVGMLTIDLPGSVKALVMILLVREVLVAIATLLIASFGAVRIDVLWVGKAGTFAAMFALPLLLASYAVDTGSTMLRVLGWGFAVPGVVLSWYAALRYVPLARQALRDGRSTRPGGVRSASLAEATRKADA